MTPNQRTAINQQNAQHSTGPKTDEGKANSSQNALKHGLSSAKLPLENPRYLELLAKFSKEHAHPASPTANVLLKQLAHIAWKLEQIPSMEHEILQASGLSLAQHFMQDKPTPLIRLWTLQTRLLSRFTSLTKTLLRFNPLLQNKPTSAVDVPSTVGPSTPGPNLQNEPDLTLDELLKIDPSFLSDPVLQNEPSFPQNLRQILASAAQSVPVPGLNPQ